MTGFIGDALSEPIDHERASRPFPAGLALLGMVLYAVAGVLTAVIEILLVPLRAGATLVPVAVVLAVASNIALPRLSRNLHSSVVGALPPVIAWIVTSVVLSSTRPEGDILLPGGASVQWVSYGVLVGGVFTGLITVALLSGAASAGARAGARRRAVSEAESARLR
jgi:hypothetical protein